MDFGTVWLRALSAEGERGTLLVVPPPFRRVWAWVAVVPPRARADFPCPDPQRLSFCSPLRGLSSVQHVPPRREDPRAPPLAFCSPCFPGVPRAVRDFFVLCVLSGLFWGSVGPGVRPEGTVEGTPPPLVVHPSDVVRPRSPGLLPNLSGLFFFAELSLDAQTVCLFFCL